VKVQPRKCVKLQRHYEMTVLSDQVLKRVPKENGNRETKLNFFAPETLTLIVLPRLYKM